MLRTDRLISLRKDKKMIQQDMADLLQISRTAYNKYEKGKSQPPSDAVVVLSDYFGVTTDYLLGNTDDPTPPSKKKPTPKTVGPALTKVLKEAGYLKNDQPLSDEEAHRILKYLMAIREADSKE